MKKRTMKKWIPKGVYCYDGKIGRCKWHKYIKTITLNKTNCEHASSCDNKDCNNHTQFCKINVYKCQFLNYTDYNQDSLLWDSCKECGIKDDMP